MLWFGGFVTGFSDSVLRFIPPGGRLREQRVENPRFTFRVIGEPLGLLGFLELPVFLSCK